MDAILRFLRRKGGFSRMREFRAASFQTRDIARLLREGRIEKIKRGLYRLPEIAVTPGISRSLVEVSHAVPSGVIALVSALAHYELTTFVPPEVYVAIPLSDKPPKLQYPPVRFFYFPARFYSLGIERIKTPAGTVRMYSMEKTICDVFRYRNKIGESLALEALRNYLRRRDSSIQRLVEFAVVCRVKTVMLPYIKAIVS